MYGLEKDCAGRLGTLKERHGLRGIKAEFEAEGSSFNDVVRLRRVTAAMGVPLYLKIGGVEALRDIRDALELGVDGLVAPMVESPFGLKKFLECVDKVYERDGVRLAINIETKKAFEDMDAIVAMGAGRIHNITLGRTDLSGSYLDAAVKPDSPFIMDILRKAGRKAREAGMEFTVGGSISVKSLPAFRELGSDLSLIQAIETRKVILDPAKLLANEDALHEALKFEELYLRSKMEIADLFLQDDRARIAKIAARG